MRWRFLPLAVLLLALLPWGAFLAARPAPAAPPAILQAEVAAPLAHRCRGAALPGGCGWLALFAPAEPVGARPPRGPLKPAPALILPAGHSPATETPPPRPV